MSETITFDEIPYTWLVPGTYAEIHANYTKVGAFDWPAHILIIGQMLASGTAKPLVPYDITRTDQAPVLFGRGSILADQVRAFLKANPYNKLSALGIVDSASGVAATQTITLTGTATATATRTVAIGDEEVTYAVAVGDAVAAQATALAAAINADADASVTAVAAAAVVTCTFRHKGECGNALVISVSDSEPTGTAWAIAAGTAGSGNPSVADAIAAIEGVWYTDITMPWTDTANLAELEAELASRYTAMGRLDAQAYIGLNATYGTASTYASSRESKFVCSIPANGSPTPPWKWGASLCAVAAYQSTNDPARQLRTLTLPGVQPPVEANRFAETERNLLLGMGHSTFTVEQDGTVALERVVTNYTETGGVADAAWRDLRTPKVSSRVRYDWRTFMQSNWPRNKLADDGSLAAEYDPTVATPNRLKASWAGRMSLYGQKGWLENTSADAKNAVFVRDTDDRNRVNARQPLTIIGAMMVMAGRLEFAA